MGQHLRHLPQPPFSQTVDKVIGRRLAQPGIQDIDDLATPSRGNLGGKSPAQQKRGPQIDSKEGIPQSQIGCGKGIFFREDSGAVNQDIHPTIPLDGGRDNALRGCGIGQVSAIDMSLNPKLAGLLPGLLGRPGRTPIMNEDMTARFSQGQRQSPANPNRTAGD